MSKISIIVPVHNVEKYLERCVDSILAQTFADFEMILIDDGSQDSSGRICDAYSLKDKRVHVVHQEYKGVSVARNVGVDWAVSRPAEWIMFVDSDDCIHPQMLDIMYSAVFKHNKRICICGYRECEKIDEWITVKSVEPHVYSVEPYYVENWVKSTVAWGKLYHKSCFRGIRYPQGKIYEDGYVTYKLLFLNKEIVVIDEPLYAYYKNPNGIMRSSWTPARMDGIQSLEEQLEYFEKNKYYLAKEACIEHYVHSLCGQCIRIKEEAKENEKKAAFRYIRPKLAIALIKYNKRFPFEKKNWFVYENAFPRMMNTYWMMRAVPNKIKKTLRKLDRKNRG